MGDENPIRTLGDYFKPSHEGYRNTIKLPAGNNMVPLRSDTIRLVQNGCSFHGLWSEDPNQHLNDFFKLVDSLDLDDENRERTHMRLVSNFMASQDAKLSKFEADFKQQQSEMTNKIDTVLKAITDRIVGTMPSDTVKNSKLGTHPVSYARSYPTIDPQCSSHHSNSINDIKAHFKEATISQTSMWQPEIETKPPQPKDPEPTLKDKFQDLHFNLPVQRKRGRSIKYYLGTCL
ncbi:hypothetical protein Tco_0883098 [Tanacetum coccineum]